MDLGVPTVQYCAEQLAYSPRYLGYEFPHHFTRLFKKVTGITPMRFLG